MLSLLLRLVSRLRAPCGRSLLVLTHMARHPVEVSLSPVKELLRLNLTICVAFLNGLPKHNFCMLQGKLCTALRLAQQNPFTIMKDLLQALVVLRKLLGNTNRLFSHTLRVFAAPALFMLVIAELVDPLFYLVAVALKLFILIRSSSLCLRVSSLILWGPIIHDFKIHLTGLVAFSKCGLDAKKFFFRRHSLFRPCIHLFFAHAFSIPRGSSTTASTLSSLIKRNSLPCTLNRVPL